MTPPNHRDFLEDLFEELRDRLEDLPGVGDVDLPDLPPLPDLPGLPDAPGLPDWLAS